MPAYLGPVGGLVPLPGVTASEISSTRGGTDKVTLGGRLKTQRSPLSRREWSVSTHDLLTSKQTASLLALELGGKPPWVWVEPYAQVTNLLSPAQSLTMPGTWSGTGVVEGGAVNVGGVMSPRSVSHSTGGTVDFAFRSAGVEDRPAVVPGVPVSVSVYARGSGELGVGWRDYAGAAISSNQKAYTHGTLARVSMVNLIPPAGAVSAYIWASGFTQAAMPALTWTPALADWSVGRGCNRVVVEGLSEAVRMASTTNTLMRRSGISFTIREVG